MSFTNFNSVFTQLNMANKNRNLYGWQMMHHYDLLSVGKYLPWRRTLTITLLRNYQRSLVPDLLYSEEDKEKMIVQYLQRGYMEYEHPGLYKFLYYRSCLGNKLQPEPPKPVNKKPAKKKEETLRLEEQMHLAYLDMHKRRYYKLWRQYLDYVEAMELADHIVQQQQQDMFYIDSMPVKAPTFTISTTVRKMRTPKAPYIMRGRVI